MGGTQGSVSQAVTSVINTDKHEGGQDEGENHEGAALQAICTDPKGPSVKAYRKFWEKHIAKAGQLPHQDAKLLEANFHWLEFAFRARNVNKDVTEWRKAGIEVATAFFPIKSFRRKLIECDFIQEVLLLWLVDEDDDDEPMQEVNKDQQRARKAQTDLQIFAAKTICAMADWADFQEFCLCSLRVMNFLCIVLNQEEAAVEIVTNTFAKLASNDSNHIILVEGAVGDILESFFKTAKFVKPMQTEEDSMAKWKRVMPALSYCAHTLATLVKFNHPCRVDLKQIIHIFRYFLNEDSSQPPRKDAPDGIRLLAEVSRLFYWIIRGSRNVTETLQEAAPTGANETVGSIAKVLDALLAAWKKCVDLHEIIAQGSVLDTSSKKWDISEGFRKFCCEDLDRSDRWEPLNKSEENQRRISHKMNDCDMFLCYMNCIIWMCLPAADIRWRMRSHGMHREKDDESGYLSLTIPKDNPHAGGPLKAYLALEVENKDFILVILGTIRHLVDQPDTQECHELVQFFSDQLLILLDKALVDHKEDIHREPQKKDEKDKRLVEREKEDKIVSLLLDALSVLAMQREAQETLAKFRVWEKLQMLMVPRKSDLRNPPERPRVSELVVLRILAEVAMHPSHRLAWVSKGDEEEPRAYPPRQEFEDHLLRKMKDTDSNFKTVSSLLLTIFQERKFEKSPEEFQITFNSVLKWWQANTTARYEELREEGPDGKDFEVGKVSGEDLQKALEQREFSKPLTSMETMQYCAPHECVLALTLFSRLALEPKYKKLFYDHALEELLLCVCSGIWAEAREAAAALANLMWLPDLNQEWLVCWLKFDGPHCVVVDASNVLLPKKEGNPKPADIGKGMYKSSWGIEFVEDSAVQLHPDGLQTCNIPGMLTSASPTDTFSNTSFRPVRFLDHDPARQQGPNEKEFTISCWFFWEKVRNPSSQQNRVLLQSSKASGSITQLYIDFQSVHGRGNPDGIWTIVDENKVRRPLTTPQLNPGWHMLALVSGTPESLGQDFGGTMFSLDTWQTSLPNVYVKNDFFMVGNASGLKNPFGLVADFRIYAQSLPMSSLEAMFRAKDASQHPDRIARRLASMNAAAILAQRIDVPDSAAECLRALASLATLSSERARIFSVCGGKVLRLLDSPLPMIKRQAARLLTNVA